VELERGDIVRHRLVQNIVNAYERAGGLQGSARPNHEAHEGREGNK
jgi:phosphate starvation-inducible protein PhoH